MACYVRMSVLGSVFFRICRCVCVSVCVCVCCRLYTSVAADEWRGVDVGGRGIMCERMCECDRALVFM